MWFGGILPLPIASFLGREASRLSDLYVSQHAVASRFDDITVRLTSIEESGDPTIS